MSGLAAHSPRRCVTHCAAARRSWTARATRAARPIASRGGVVVDKSRSRTVAVYGSADRNAADRRQRGVVDRPSRRSIGFVTRSVRPSVIGRPRRSKGKNVEIGGCAGLLGRAAASRNRRFLAAARRPATASRVAAASARPRRSFARARSSGFAHARDASRHATALRAAVALARAAARDPTCGPRARERIARRTSRRERLVGAAAPPLRGCRRRKTRRRARGGRGREAALAARGQHQHERPRAVGPPEGLARGRRARRRIGWMRATVLLPAWRRARARSPRGASGAPRSGRLVKTSSATCTARSASARICRPAYRREAMSSGRRADRATSFGRAPRRRCAKAVSEARRANASRWSGGGGGRWKRRDRRPA